MSNMIKLGRRAAAMTFAACLTLGATVAGAQQPGAVDHSKMDHGAGAAGGPEHGGMSMMGGMEHGAAGHGGGDHGGGDHGGGMGGGHAMMKKMMCGVAEHVDGRLAYLKAELKLTEQQTPQWNAFVEGFRAATQKTAQHCDEMDQAGHDHSGHAGVLGQLAMMDHHMTAHLDQIRALKSAIEPLYNALTDEQKKTADETLGSVMKVGMGAMTGH